MIQPSRRPDRRATPQSFSNSRAISDRWISDVPS